jgi:acetyl-CoA acetyltransferase
MAATEVVISGIGQSAVGRKINRSGLALTIDAALEAIADAGLTRADIDGVSNYPGYRPDMIGFGPVGAADVIEALRLKVNWYSGGTEGAAQFSALVNAYAAVKSGLARHVLCFRTVKEGSAGTYWKDTAAPSQERMHVGWDFQWRFPYNAFSAINWLALYAQRHFYLYGTRREHLGAIAVNARRNAMLNPKAIYKDPMSMDDYLASKMISSPFCLFDCDAPTDASTAIILSSAEAAEDLPSTPIHIESVGCALHTRPSWDQVATPKMAAFDAADMMWARTDYKPHNVQVAELYDGFSFLTMTWLEALGFCKVGESGAFVEDGKRIAREGELPLNTNGGQLSGGRTHGFGFVHETVVQLRGKGGVRQAANEPKVGVAAAGGGPLAGCMLLARH